MGNSNSAATGQHSTVTVSPPSRLSTILNRSPQQQSLKNPLFQHHSAVSIDCSVDDTNELIRSYKSPTSPLKLKLGSTESIEPITANFIQTLDGDVSVVHDIQLQSTKKLQHARHNTLRLSLSEHDIHYIRTMDSHSHDTLPQHDSDNSDIRENSTYVVSDTGTLIAGEFEINSHGIQIHNNYTKEPYLHSVSSKRSKHELNSWFMKQRTVTNSPKSPKPNLLSPTLSYKSSSHTGTTDMSCHKSPYSAPVLPKSQSERNMHMDDIDSTPVKSTYSVTSPVRSDISTIDSHIHISELTQITDTLQQTTITEPIDTLTLCESDLIMLDTIGRGQNGSVMKAVHKHTLTRVALKKMSISDTAHQHQLQHELHTMIHLSDCHNIVQFLGAYADTGYITLALEYMDCGSLATLIKHNGALGIHRQFMVQHIVLHTLYGLQYLHQAHTVHRDIKPDNILLSHSGSVKITDFGLATELQQNTTADTYVGTLSYLAPERLLTQQYSYSSDIWSLGLTIVYIAVGSLPIQFNDYWSLHEMFTKYDSLPITLLHSDDGWCRELIEFVSLCLQYNPDSRATADILLQHKFLSMKFDTAVPIEQCTEFQYALHSNMQDITVVLKLLAEQDIILDTERIQQLSDEYGISVVEIQGRYHTLQQTQTMLKQISIAAS